MSAAFVLTITDGQDTQERAGDLPPSGDAIGPALRRVKRDGRWFFAGRPLMVNWVPRKESNWMRDESGRSGRAAGPARASRPSPPGTGVAARREFWARLRSALWQPPRPHGEQPRERMVGPLELFYDLAVVVLVAQAAHRLAGHLTWPGLGEFTVVFTLVWIAWANGSLHHELHGREDTRARSTFLLQILVLAAAQTAEGVVAEAGLDEADSERVGFVLTNLVDALAPSNNPLLNPAAVKTAIDTGGGSVLAGLRHFVADMAVPPRVPSMVEPDAYQVGVDLAVTPGSVILRTPVFELIQYRPTTRSCGTWWTWRRSTPSRAPRPCRRPSSAAPSPASGPSRNDLTRGRRIGRPPARRRAGRRTGRSRSRP